MKALTWHGKGDVRVDDAPEPKIEQPRDAILKITSTAICGSDLHLYDGVIPSLKPGDILGHEFMGEVVEVGPEVKSALKVGDRVVVPFTIACGSCFFCKKDLWSCCDNTIPAEEAELAELAYGYPPSGLFGYTHMLGGYAGGQAEYVRVPYADVGPIKAPSGLPDEKVLFLSDIFPTGYQAAENCNIQPGDTVAVWGCGPVGQFAVRSAFMLGAERVIAIDHHSTRLQMAAEAGAEALNYKDYNVLEALKEMTNGIGPDSCIDSVGMEAHGLKLDNVIDFAKMQLKLATDRPSALREAIMACRKGGTVSVPGVYGGLVDGLPLGAAFGKGLTLKMGQTHVHKYLKPLLERVEKEEIDPSFIISHRMALADAPMGYKAFKEQQNEFTKIVLTP